MDNEPPHPTKRGALICFGLDSFSEHLHAVKRAETRQCPICDEAVPLRLLAKHAELESERVDEILSKIGSSDVQYESACEYVDFICFTLWIPVH
jgi:hypothetical protein